MRCGSGVLDSARTGAGAIAQRDRVETRQARIEGVRVLRGNGLVRVGAAVGGQELAGLFGIDIQFFAFKFGCDDPLLHHSRPAGPDEQQLGYKSRRLPIFREEKRNAAARQSQGAAEQHHSSKSSNKGFVDCLADSFAQGG